MAVGRLYTRTSAGGLSLRAPGVPRHDRSEQPAAVGLAPPNRRYKACERFLTAFRAVGRVQARLGRRSCGRIPGCALWTNGSVQRVALATCEAGFKRSRVGARRLSSSNQLAITGESDHNEGCLCSNTLASSASASSRLSSARVTRPSVLRVMAPTWNGVCRFSRRTLETPVLLPPRK